MRYKHLEKPNVDVSVLAAGTWLVGGDEYGDVTEKDCIKAIHTLLDNGVNLIDTAPCYGNGHSEEVVGRAIAGLDRSKFMISTKCGIKSTTSKCKRHPEIHEGKDCRDGSYTNVLFEVEQSLRRMKTDYIDFLFIHWPDYDTPFSETMEAINTLKREGKIRFAGLSNFCEEQIEECEKVARIDVIQPPYSMVARRDENLMKYAAAKGIGTFTYGSLGAGILTGAFRSEPTFDPMDARSTFYPFFKEPDFGKVMKVLDVMDIISSETGRPLSQIALNWSTQKDYVTAALCGSRNEKEALENVSAFQWELTDDQIARLDAAIKENIDFDGTIDCR